jgi:predicted nucleic acid-binding protein
MSVFVDTSAFMAVINAEDRFNPQAVPVWNKLLTEDTPLETSNYVVLETVTLLQSRRGMDAVRAFVEEVLPLLVVEWITREAHQAALAAFVTADRRDLSLVDCANFEVMRRRGIKSAFAFDTHFQEQGFVDVTADKSDQN